MNITMRCLVGNGKRPGLFGNLCRGSVSAWGVILLSWIVWNGFPIQAHAAAPRPNILFILVDDLGYGDIGVFYQNFRRDQHDPTKPWHRTPNLDRMAREGIQLRDHYCPAPVCAPSRASLLLGVHQGHSNVRDNQFDKALEDNYTLASVLKAAGYATACIGKYGLQGQGSNPQQWPAYPTKRGFDYFFGYVRHRDGHEHYPKEGKYRGRKEVWENDREVSDLLDKCYTADLWTARAKQWIIDHCRKHPDQPFFLYLAYDTPHAVLELPTQAYPPGRGLHGGLQWLGQPHHMINTASGTIDSWIHPDYRNATYNDGKNPHAPWPEVYKRYATSVRRIDTAIGDLLQLLRDLHIDRNTLVIFTSDNGPSRESYLPQAYHPTFFHSFGPFDGIKRDCWEGGVRVGAIAWWPGTIPAGRISHLPSAFWDWMPTFCELAGVPPPAKTDGRSLVPTLIGRGRQRPPLVYIEYFQNGRTPNYSAFLPAHRGRRRRQMQVIRIGNYVGVRYDIQSANDPFEIYRIDLDPQQRTNLAAKLPHLQRQMKELALQVRHPGGGVRRPYDTALVPAVHLRRPLRKGLVHYALYQGRWPWVPDFQTLQPIAEGEIQGITLKIPSHSLGKETVFSTSNYEIYRKVASRQTNYGIMFTGYFIAPRDGTYTFFLQSDHGALLRIHQAIVIDDDAHHDGSEVRGTIRLQAGPHPFTLSYRHQRGPEILRLYVQGPGMPKQEVTGEFLGLEKR